MSDHSTGQTHTELQRKLRRIRCTDAYWTNRKLFVVLGVQTFARSWGAWLAGWHQSLTAFWGLLIVMCQLAGTLCIVLNVQRCRDLRPILEALLVAERPAQGESFQE